MLLCSAIYSIEPSHLAEGKPWEQVGEHVGSALIVVVAGSVSGSRIEVGVFGHVCGKF